MTVGMTTSWNENYITVVTITLFPTNMQTRKCHNLLCTVLHSTESPNYLGLWYLLTHIQRAKFSMNLCKNSLHFHESHLSTINFSTENNSISHAFTIFSYSPAHYTSYDMQFIHNLVLINSYWHYFLWVAAPLLKWYSFGPNKDLRASFWFEQ